MHNTESIRGMVACPGNIYRRDRLLCIFGVITDWIDSKVATGLWDSFRFLNALFPCLSKKPASCNPNEGGDSELPKAGVQTKWMLSNEKVEHHFLWIQVCCLSLLSHHYQEMHYLILKHFGIYDCGKQILGGREWNNAPQHVSCTSCNDVLPQWSKETK